jgi:hypothetical protein
MKTARLVWPPGRPARRLRNAHRGAGAGRPDRQQTKAGDSRQNPPRTQGHQARPHPDPGDHHQHRLHFRDETGYNGAMTLAIEQARVLAFEATVNIPRHGSCRFDLRNFRQTRELPTVELRHQSDQCVVRVWEQGERLTVAFHECRKMCSGNAWEQLWPILNDRRDGTCA